MFKIIVDKKTKTNKNKIGLSKKLLRADYVVAVVLIAIFLICMCINGIYTMKITNELTGLGVDISTVVITPPFNLDIFGIILGIWITQLGISSAAYYVLVKSEHKMELPMQLLNDLPKDIKEQIDLTQVITSVLSSTDN